MDFPFAQKGLEKSCIAKKAWWLFKLNLQIIIDVGNVIKHIM